MNLKAFLNNIGAVPYTTDAEKCSRYSKDESRSFGASVSAVLYPSSAEDVAVVMRASREFGVPVTVSGARTGISGGAVPTDGVVLTCERIAVAPSVYLREGELIVSVSPSLSLAELAELLATPFRITAGDENALQLLHREKRGWLYPVDPTEMTASVGGSVATNASGARSFFYGATRKWIRGLQVILPDGETVVLPRGRFVAEKGTMQLISESGKRYTFHVPDYTMPSVKNAAGLFSEPTMDAVDLFIGSEGILGVVVGVDIAIIPRPKSFSLLSAVPDEKSAFRMVSFLREQYGQRLLFLEFADARSLALLKNRAKEDETIRRVFPIIADAAAVLFFDVKIENDSHDELRNIISALDNIINRFTSSDRTIVALTADEQHTIRHIRHLIPESVNEVVSEHKKVYDKLHKIGTDFAVPHEQFTDIYHSFCAMIEERHIPFVVFGHIGQSHLHFNLLPQTPEQLADAKKLYRTMAERAVAAGGTISAEHGVGKIKTDYLYVLYGDKGVNEIRRVKAVFDPHFLLNRGTMIAP